MPLQELRAKYPVLEWVTPFAVFMLLLAVSPSLGIPQPWESVFRVGILAAVIVLFSWRIVGAMRVRHLWSSIALGLAVFVLWIAPDYLISGWREHWIFQNAIFGSLTTTIPPEELSDPLVVILRIARAAILVPIIEELFWRGWLPRWIVNPNWQKVPLGSYSVIAFAVTALLFASEHGPYWEVGLLCGLIYNWWMWRTKSLGDIVLVHAVTNAALSGYVLLTGQYQYWM